MTSKHHHSSLLSKVFGSHRKKTKNKGEELELNQSDDVFSLSNVSISRSAEVPNTPNFDRKRTKSSTSIFDSLRKLFPDENESSKHNIKTRPKISTIFHENEALTKIIPVEKPFDEDESVYYINGLPVNVYTAKRKKVIKKIVSDNSFSKENENESRVTFINGMPVNVYTDKVKKVVKKTVPPISRDQNNNRINNRLSMKSSIIYRQSIANFDYIEKAREYFIQETLNANEATPSLNESLDDNSSGSPSSNRSSRTSFMRKRINSSTRSNSNLGGLLNSNRIKSREVSPFPMENPKIDDEKKLSEETDEKQNKIVQKASIDKDEEQEENLNEILEKIDKEFEQINKLDDEVNNQEINNSKDLNEFLYKERKDEKEKDIFKEIELDHIATKNLTDNNTQENTDIENSSSKAREIKTENEILMEIQKDLETNNHFGTNNVQEKSVGVEDDNFDLLDDSGSSNLFNRLTSNFSSSSTDIETCKPQIESSPHTLVESILEEQSIVKVTKTCILYLN